MKKIIKVLSGTVISLGMFNSTAYADTINYINYGSIVNNGVINNIDNSINNSVINNIDNSINNTNINYNVDERQFEGPYDEGEDDEEDYDSYDEIYATPKNVNVSKKITIGQNVPYNNITGTGWVKRNDGELMYFENNVQAINEWKEFPDGYRHFNDVGIMNHRGGDYYADWIWFNEDGTAKSESEDFEVYIPHFSSDCLKEPYALDYVKHTLDVFNWQYDIEYKDTYNINEDGTIYKVETPHIHSDNYGRNEDIEGSYTIYLYKYKDRGSFIK